MSRYYRYEIFGNKALGHVNIFELRDVCGVELATIYTNQN